MRVIAFFFVLARAAIDETDGVSRRNRLAESGKA
jgi:hypothetical protein